MQMNPLLSKEHVARELARDPISGRSEWLAEFRPNAAMLLPADLISAAIDEGCEVRPPLPGVRYVGFVDGSGGVNDSFVTAIAHKDEDGSLVLDALLERVAPFQLEQAVADSAGLLRMYRCQQVHGDRYAGATMAQMFQRHGVRYASVSWVKSQIYVGCLPLFASGRVRLLDNGRLTAQLKALQRRSSAAGRERIVHHGLDDVANAVCAALQVAAMQQEQQTKWVAPPSGQYTGAGNYWDALGPPTLPWDDRRPPSVMNSVAPADLKRMFNPKKH